MTRISFNMDAEDAIYTLFGCAALVNNFNACEGSHHVYEDMAVAIIERAVMASAIAIDREFNGGELTKFAPFFEREGE